MPVLPARRVIRPEPTQHPGPGARHQHVTTLRDTTAPSPAAAERVAELHQAPALALVRVATLLLGDQASAEDLGPSSDSGPLTTRSRPR